MLRAEKEGLEEETEGEGGRKKRKRAHAIRDRSSGSHKLKERGVCCKSRHTRSTARKRATRRASPTPSPFLPRAAAVAGERVRRELRPKAGRARGGGARLQRAGGPEAEAAETRRSLTIRGSALGCRAPGKFGASRPGGPRAQKGEWLRGLSAGGFAYPGYGLGTGWRRASERKAVLGMVVPAPPSPSVNEEEARAFAFSGRLKRLASSSVLPPLLTTAELTDGASRRSAVQSPFAPQWLFTESRA